MVIKKKGGIGNFISEGFFKSLGFVRQNSGYIYLVSCLFLFFGLIGFLFPIFFKEEIVNIIKELVEKTEGLNAFELTRFIFINNTLSSFFAIILGIMFGIFSIFTIVVNGYIVGFVSSFAVAEEGVSVLWRLLPHGIFEIPAIMISAGLGLKIGFSLLYEFVRKIKSVSKSLSYLLILILFISFVFSFIPLLIMTIIDENLRKKFLDNLVNSLKVFVFVVIPLLVIAAIIEGVLIYFVV